MWADLYEKLSNSEKEEFKRLANFILARTFLLRDVYDAKEGMVRVNPEYRFVERHFELFMDYLQYSGWTLMKDSSYGVIVLENAYEYNRIRLDRLTTLILFTLRLIFEEEREKVTLRKEILTTTGQVVHKMLALSVVKRKPADRDLASGLRLLANHNVIQKVEGLWEEAENRFLILPSVLFIVTNQKISELYDTLKDAEENGGEQPENESADTDGILRGDEDGR